MAKEAQILKKKKLLESRQNHFHSSILNKYFDYGEIILEKIAMLVTYL